VNHKRVYRLYRQEGLGVRRRKRKRIGAVQRQALVIPPRQNERWSMDFISDALSEGRKFRSLNIVDDFNRECLAAEVDTSITGARVVRVLERLRERRGMAQILVMDNGPEFAGQAVDVWAYEQGTTLHFIEPGKPVQIAFIESFNGKMRDECLNEHWFLSRGEARETIEAWRRDYDEVRPHTSLGNRTRKNSQAPGRLSPRAAPVRRTKAKDSPPTGELDAGNPLSGSEGGGTEYNPFSLPLSILRPCRGCGTATRNGKTLSAKFWLRTRAKGQGLYDPGVAGGAGSFHGLVTALCLYLLHDTVHMILDCKLRETQPRSDLFIRQAFGDKRNELLLTYREAGQGSPLNLDRRLPGKSGHSTKERKAQPGRTDGLPPGRGTDGCNNIACRGVIQQVTRYPGANRQEELLFVLFHANQHDPHCAIRLLPIEEADTKWQQHLEIIQHKDVALGIKDVNGFGRAALPNHAQIRPFAKQTNQCLANEAVLDKQEHSRRIIGQPVSRHCHYSCAFSSILNKAPGPPEASRTLCREDPKYRTPLLCRQPELLLIL
jgi:putative transposase